MLRPAISKMRLEGVEAALYVYSRLANRTEADYERMNLYLDRWDELHIEAVLTDIAKHYHESPSWRKN